MSAGDFVPALKKFLDRMVLERLRDRRIDRVQVDDERLPQRRDPGDLERPVGVQAPEVVQVRAW